MNARQPLLALSTLLLLAACGQNTPNTPTSDPLAGLSEALTKASRGGEPGGLSAQALSCPTVAAAPYDASKLDTGLYWYAQSDTSAPGGAGCKAKTDGSAIPGYYDPSKPVLIFVHGWKNGSVQDGLISGTSMTNSRDNFWFTETSSNVADAWIKAGWNVGIFQWTQLADDEGSISMPFNSQAKIWTPNYTYSYFGTKTINMRYRVAGGSYSTTNMPTVSASQLFYDAYKSALSQWNYAGTEKIRVMGHSLGAQMALGMADKAYADTSLPTAKKPARIILADPYWTPNTPNSGHNYTYLTPDANPAARSARIAQTLKSKGAVIEWIKSSQLVDLGGDNNLPMAKFVSRTEIFPEYVQDSSLTNSLTRKHLVAPKWYMLTFNDPARTGVSAANTFSAAQSLMNSGVRYDQNLGRSTTTSSDDTFTSAANP